MQTEVQNPSREADGTPPTGPGTVLTGALHVYVAFDWGDEVDLERARLRTDDLYWWQLKSQRQRASATSTWLECIASWPHAST